MKRFISSVILAAAMLASTYSNASIIVLPADGVVADSVIGDSGWISEDTFGDALDFITFELTEAYTFSATTDSAITMGLSLYSGMLTNDFGIPFSNSGDFTDFFSDLSYLAGNNPFVPGLGGNLTSMVLDAGAYTLAIGGNEGFFDTFTQFDYTLNVSLEAVNQVSEPSVLFMMFFGIAGLLAARKQNS